MNELDRYAVSLENMEVLRAQVEGQAREIERLSGAHNDAAHYASRAEDLRAELDALKAKPARAGDELGHDTKGSRKALGAMNAKLRAKIGRLERELAALSANHSEQVREGWKLVPVKPSIDMVEAGYEASLGRPDRGSYARVIEQYDAMLSASPSAGSQGGAE